MGWNIEGIDAVLRAMQAGQRKAPRVFDQELYRGGQKILAASIKVTPREFGGLRGSGTVEKVDGGVEIGFGGSASEYAMIVHERMGNIRWSVPGTGPKYLEKPFVQMAPAVIDNAFKKAAAAVKGK